MFGLYITKTTWFPKEFEGMNLEILSNIPDLIHSQVYLHVIYFPDYEGINLEILSDLYA